MQHRRSRSRAPGTAASPSQSGKGSPILRFHYPLFVRLAPRLIAMIPLGLLVTPLFVESVQPPSTGASLVMLAFFAFFFLSTPTEVALTPGELRVRYPLGLVRRVARDGSRFWLRRGRYGSQVLCGAPLGSAGLRGYLHKVEVSLRNLHDGERLVRELGARAL